MSSLANRLVLIGCETLGHRLSLIEDKDSLRVIGDKT